MTVTKRRYDEHSTEFGLWLRDQREIDSNLGYVPTNVDYVWRFRWTNQWLYLEEKRYLASCKPFQLYTFRILHDLALADPLYYGFHFIAFENTSPLDGKVYLDFQEIDRAQLIAFFQFAFPKSCYFSNGLFPNGFPGGWPVFVQHTEPVSSYHLA